MPSIALLDGPLDKVAKSAEVSWEELTQALHAVEYTDCLPCIGHDCPAKLGRCWSPVKYVPGATKHIDREIEAITFAVFDLDEPPPERMAALAQALDGHAYLVHQTHRGNGYRLVLPLLEPVPAAMWRGVWAAIAARFDLPKDETCLNESRIYFTPTRPRGSGFEVYDGIGKALDWRGIDPLFRDGVKTAIANFSAAVHEDLATDPTDPKNLRAGPLDLEELRRSVAAMRRPESRQLLDTILGGRKLTENDPADVGFRDTTLNRACSLLATAPLGKAYPVEAVVELMYGSIRAMECAPEGLEAWLDKAREKYLRALGRRLENDARHDSDKAAIMRALGQGPGALPQPGSEDTGWRRELIQTTNAEGEPSGLRPIGANANTIFEREDHWVGQLRFNEITKEIDVMGGPLLGKPKASLDVEAANWLARSEFRLFLKPHDVGEQMLAVARKHAFDPLIDWMNTLKHDGKPRVQTFFRDYFGATGEQLHLDAISQAFLISCVARAMQPGCEVHTVPILIGAQGVGKSRSLRALGGAFFTPASLNLGDKDSRILASSNWIIELAELAAIRGADQERIKAFISEPFDKIRPPYGKVHETFMRRCVFVGTTNEDEILSDWTGNRRWWPIYVTKGDVARIEADRDQIFAEALAMYRAGVRWHLDDIEAARAERIASGFKRPSARAEQILSWFAMKSPNERPKTLSTFDMLNTILGVPSAQIGPANTTEVGHAARELGFTKHRKRLGGTLMWLYTTPVEILTMAKDAKPAAVEIVTQSKTGDDK